MTSGENLSGRNFFIFFTFFHRVLNVSIPSPYRFLTAYNVLVPASVTVLAVPSPGPHRVATGPLPPGTPPYRSLNVRSALLTSHTVYKSWALTRPVTLQCTYSSSFFSKFFIILYDTSSPFSPPHERVHNGLVPAHRPYTVHLPSSYRVLTVCHRLYPHGESFGHAQNFRRVSPAANGPPTCSPIAQRPAVCPHRVPPSARNLPHGGTR